MANIVVRRLANPTEDEYERAVSTLLAAFEPAPDSFGHSLTGGDRTLRPLFHDAHLRAGAIGGEVWVAGFGPTDICAVAVWFGPGTDYLETEEQRAAGWNQLEAKFTPELKQWWSEYFTPRYSKWNESCVGEGTKFKSWQLQLLGTNPEYQRKGLAAALIQAIEAKAIADGVIMCLETIGEPNVAFYKQRGFSVRSEVLSIVGAGGEVTMTCLSKP
ncbi:hypothetical protein B0H11DRAFT_1997924 [Mycena galericulata]|nr:hypothetical protein B0H11DRAFT_1997924 [Mycena galericulata]